MTRPKALKVGVFLYRIPIVEPIVTSFGVMLDRPSLIIRLEDEEGHLGWGEVWCNFPTCGAEHRARLLVSTILPLAEALGEGKSPSDLHQLLESELHVLGLQTGEMGPIAQCLAGFECALQDLNAHRLGLPLHKSLNPNSGSTVNVYASGINPKNAASTARRAIDAGHTACKIKLGFGFEKDEQNLRQTRAEIGPGIKLMADVNQRWSRKLALEMVEPIQNAGLFWLEEPLMHSAGDADWREVGVQLGVPLAAGENFYGNDFDTLPKNRGLSFVQPDPGKWGGVSGGLRVAKSAIEKGYTYCPHWLGGPIGLLIAMHMTASLNEPSSLVEADFNIDPFRDAIMEPIVATLNRGSVTLSQSPGIGIDPGALVEFNPYIVFKHEQDLFLG